MKNGSSLRGVNETGAFINMSFLSNLNVAFFNGPYFNKKFAMSIQWCCAIAMIKTFSKTAEQEDLDLVILTKTGKNILPPRVADPEF